MIWQQRTWWMWHLADRGVICAHYASRNESTPYSDVCVTLLGVLNDFVISVCATENIWRRILLKRCSP